MLPYIGGGVPSARAAGAQRGRKTRKEGDRGREKREGGGWVVTRRRWSKRAKARKYEKRGRGAKSKGVKVQSHHISITFHSF